MSNDSWEICQYEVPLRCRYLLHVPEAAAPETLLVLALHGYGSNPSDMLRLARMAVGRAPVIAALQGPHQYYGSQLGPDARPAYNWGVRQHWDDAVRQHQAMVGKVLADLRARFSIGPGRCALLGFSQPVGLNYRFAATHPDQVRGVIAICGGVPRDWEEGEYETVAAAILHISREQDEFYPAEIAAGFEKRLRSRAADVEFHLIPGSHRFPSKASQIVQPWIERVFSRDVTTK